MGVTASFNDTYAAQDLDLTQAQFQYKAKFEKAKSQSLILSGTYFSHLPDVRQATFRDDPKLYQALLPERLNVAKEQRHDVLLQLGALRDIAQRTNDKRTDTRLLVHELRLEGGFASVLYGAISRHGQSWFLPAFWLLLLVLVFFPITHLAVHGKLPITNNEIITAYEKLDIPCNRDAEGSALAAAMELSIKNAMIVGADNEPRLRRINTCLGVSKTTGFIPSVMASIIEAAQLIVTAIFLFFIGAAIRRRLQMR